MQIIPALLEKNPESLFFQIRRLSAYFNLFQIDIADGIFVPNITVQIDNILSQISYVKHLPSNIELDFHLMVKDYISEVKNLMKLKKIVNIKNIFIHYSLRPNYSLLTTNYPQFSFGLVLNPDDSVDELYKLYNFKTIRSVQIMSINPGFQGSAFLPETLKKIERLRSKNYRNKIYLDGAINQDTLPTILSLKQRPDCLCIGSYLTQSPSLKKSVDDLKKTLQK